MANSPAHHTRCRFEARKERPGYCLHMKTRYFLSLVWRMAPVLVENLTVDELWPKDKHTRSGNKE